MDGNTPKEQGSRKRGRNPEEKDKKNREVGRE